MTCWFVTGTDTEIGKTVTAAALAAALVSAGREVAIHKPAQTGMASEQEEGDAGWAARMSGAASATEGFRLGAPLAPVRAAAFEGRELPTIDACADEIRRLADRFDDVIVEGSGGTLVDLVPGFGIADLAVRTAVPGSRMLVTVRAGLGTLNHAALTVEALSARGIRREHTEVSLAGLVIGSWPEHPGLAEKYNLADLVAIAPIVGRIPVGAGSLTPERFRELAPGFLTGVRLDG